MEHGGGWADRGLIEVERGEGWRVEAGWQRQGWSGYLGPVATSGAPALNASLEGQGARWRVFLNVVFETQGGYNF